VVREDLDRSLQAGRPMPNDPRQSLGKCGEDLACAELERRGYAILARRYRTRFGEIDIVARDGETMVFVEVKARDGERFGAGAEAVTAWKQRRIAGMALDYVARHRWHDRPCRFDVVAIDVSAKPPLVEVYVNAFEAAS
jgi:putative endonuclease